MENYQLRNFDRGHLNLFGEVDDEKVCTLIEQLTYLERKRSLKEVTLWINSAGGLLLPAFGLADVMELLDKPIRTIGLGTVESAATVVLASGTPGRRLLTRNASVMLHEYSWSNSGSMTEMAGRMTEIQNTARKQIEHLMKVTGLPEERIRGVLLRHQETWLTPVQTVEVGLVDAILDFNPMTRQGGPAGRGRAEGGAARKPARKAAGRTAKKPAKKSAKARKPAKKKARKPSKKPAKKK